MTRHPRFEIRIAGFGGQGVVTIGNILGAAFSVYGNKNSVSTQSYGPEARGGACRSEVVVCDGEINYPCVRKADVLVALSQVALETYGEDLKKEAIVVIDTDAVKTIPAGGHVRLYQVPTVTIARETGDVKYQNAVALGALYALISELISEESLLQALREGVPSKTLNANLTAFEKGRDYVQSQLAQEG